ncbi:hypothetical protein C8J57DRAFT_1642842 [Mycena rebaudengoi]|nr:hypothetical protein C8J57DRAFT_1642842 [Mycena rebaudengoi]
MEDLPQELVDHVFDDVATSKNTTDLRTCSSVCRRWLHRSREHLFSHITLSNNSHTAVQRFLTLVDEVEGFEAVNAVKQPSFWLVLVKLLEEIRAHETCTWTSAREQSA